MPSNERRTHRERIAVRSYETDPHGRLQAPILCQLLQEVATAHAGRLGVSVESLIDRGVAWVLSRLELEMKRWPGADEEIVITTWPEAMNRLFIERRFSIADVEERSIGAVSTLWLVLDLARRRPVRLPATITDRMGALGVGSEPMRPDNLEPPSTIDRERRFTVRRSDLDLAGHVNNTSYVAWAVEAVSDEIWEASDLDRLEIRFLAECHHGQTVRSACQEIGRDESFEVRHQILRDEDGIEAARAHTVWRRR